MEVAGEALLEVETAKGGYATRWLHGKLASGGHTSILKASGHYTSTIQAFDELVSFWEQIWHREAQCEELERLRTGNLTREQAQPAQDWQLQASGLHAAASAKRDGAARPDGWSCAEIHAWPEHAWHIYLDIWQRWASRDQWPTQLSRSFCRRTKVRGPTASLLSMDMRKGFDMAHPALMTGLLRHHGLPELWTRHFVNVWHCQKRWMQHGRYMRERPVTVTTATPQGDPFAPLAFVVLLCEAGRRLPDHVPHTAQTLYVDDRNAIVRGAQAAAQVWQYWLGWTRRLGLEENETKLKIVPKRASLREAVQRAGLDARRLTAQARVLGVDFLQEGMGEEPTTAMQRWESGRKLIARLASAGLAARRSKLISAVPGSLLGWLGGDG